MTISAQDIRQAARTLAKHKGFTTVAVLSLALAIALNTTMYSVLDALVNPKTDVVKPEQLFQIAYFGDFRNRVATQARNGMLRSGGRTYQAITFQGGYAYYQSLIEHGPQNMRGDVKLVSADYFHVLGVHPVAGRLFVQEDLTAPERPMVVSERLQRKLFPRGESAVGQSITIGDAVYRVIGVLPSSGDFFGSRDAGWVLPFPDRPSSSYMLNVIRLRDGMTRQQAEAEFHVLSTQIAGAVGESQKDNGFVLAPMTASQLHLSNFHYAIIGAVIAVLLVACANIANLQLARGLTRGRELATRAALGASRRDLIRHLMLESGLLGAAGLTLGLILTFWGMSLVTASIPDNIGDYIVEPQTSWRLFAFAAVVALVALMLVGLLPAVRVSRVDPNDLMKSGNGTGSFRRSRRQYGVLLAAEIGFALLVSCGASLLVRSARQIRGDADVGYETRGLSMGYMSIRILARSSMPVQQLADEVNGRVRTTPDLLEGAVVVGHTDKDGEVSATDPAGGLRVAPAAMWGYNIVSPSYFRTYGVSMLHGRDFMDGETGNVAIVDPATARALWPTSSPVGQMIKFGSPGTPGAWYTVIGVAAPMGTPGAPNQQNFFERYYTPSASSMVAPRTKQGSRYKIGGRDRSVYVEAGSPAGVYVLPTPSDSISRTAPQYIPSVRFIVRSRHNDPHAPLAIRHAFQGDPRLVVMVAMALDDWTGATTARANHNFVASMFTLFAVLAIAMAALGVYAIVSHSVAERRREIGVRLALGASDKGVLAAVLGEGNAFLLAGVALGLFLTRYSTTMLRAFLWVPEIDPYAIELFVPVAMGMFAIAVTAALAPAFRATRIDPVESLRCE